MNQNSQNIVFNTQEPLGFLKFYAILEFTGQFTLRCMYYFQKGVDNFEIEHKTC